MKVTWVEAKDEAKDEEDGAKQGLEGGKTPWYAFNYTGVIVISFLLFVTIPQVVSHFDHQSNRQLWMYKEKGGFLRKHYGTYSTVAVVLTVYLVPLVLLWVTHEHKQKLEDWERVIPGSVPLIFNNFGWIEGKKGTLLGEWWDDWLHVVIYALSLAFVYFTLRDTPKYDDVNYKPDNLLLLTYIYVSLVYYIKQHILDKKLLKEEEEE